MASNFPITPTKEQNGHDSEPNTTPIKFSWTSPSSFSFQKSNNESPSFMDQSASSSQKETNSRDQPVQSPRRPFSTKGRRNLNKPSSSNDTFFIPTSESRALNLPSNTISTIKTSLNGFTFQGKNIGSSSSPFVFGAQTDLPSFAGLASESKNISWETTTTTASGFKLTPSKLTFSQSPNLNLFNNAASLSSSKTSSNISSLHANNASKESHFATKKKTTVFSPDNFESGGEANTDNAPSSFAKTQANKAANGLLTTVEISTSSFSESLANTSFHSGSQKPNTASLTTNSDTVSQVVSSGSTQPISSFSLEKSSLTPNTSAATFTPTFNFGQTSSNTTSNPTFSFGKLTSASKTTTATTSNFSFAQHSSTSSNNPTFNFGQSTILNPNATAPPLFTPSSSSEYRSALPTSPLPQAGTSSTNPNVSSQSFNLENRNLTTESASNFWKSPNGAARFFMDRKTKTYTPETRNKDDSSKTEDDCGTFNLNPSDYSSDEKDKINSFTRRSSLPGASSSTSNLRGETDVDKLKDGIDQLKALLSELNSVRPLNDMRTISTMIGSLEKTVENVRETFKCEICFVRQYNYFYFCHDCGRLVGCFLCAYKLDRCPTCRKRLPPRKNRSPYVIPGLAFALKEKEITRADLWKEVEKIRL